MTEAKNEARKAVRERAENQIKLDRNARRGREFERSKRKPGMAMGLDKTVQSALPGNFTQPTKAWWRMRVRQLEKPREPARAGERIYLELVQDALPLGRKVTGITSGEEQLLPLTQSTDLKNAYTQNTVSRETQPYKVDYLLQIQDFPRFLS